ncbi:hypothetical protein EV14_1096 [Prochlorococcus sp. MIT 0703]|nr:hypothetical protein EV12_1255 [Prochlorococcus sp. MIT 0701]KGG34512.1 hypothetical protein EV14_1096 [Prochlorococcus sp. MIT 0703]
MPPSNAAFEPASSVQSVVMAWEGHASIARPGVGCAAEHLWALSRTSPARLAL